MKSEEMNTEISEIGVPSPDLSDLGGELEKKSLMKEKSSAPGELEIKLKEIAEEITKELEEKREGAYDEYSIMLKTTLEQKMEPIPFTAGPEIKNITERIDRIDEELRMVRKEVENITERVENITERIDRIEDDLIEHVYKREGAYEHPITLERTTLEMSKTTLKLEPIPFTAGPEIKNITERIDRIDEELRMVRKEVENTTERIDRIENDLTEHIYKPLVKGIGISTALLGILFAVTSSILAIPVFIISYLCFWGLWKSKKS